MNEITHTLEEGIKKHLSDNNYDVTGIIPIPSKGNPMTRLQTLQEILEEAEEAQNQDDSEVVVEYLIQIRRKKESFQTPAAFSSDPLSSKPFLGNEFSEAKPSNETVYLENGKFNIPYLLKNADLLQEAGEFNLARKIYKTVVESGEFTSVAFFRMGKSFEAEGKLDDAKISYEESIAYHPTLEAYQKLISLLIRQGKDRQAAEAIERAVNLKEISSRMKFELHKAAGNCWVRVNRYEEAERNFKKALELDPAADEVRSNLGVLYLQQNKTTEAKRHFQDAIASNPKNYQALCGLGSCFATEGNKNNAHDSFAQALSVNLNNPAVIAQLVKCAYEIKRYSKAAAILEEYVQTCPVNSNVIFSLAGLQFHLGRIAEAKANALQTLKLDPQHTGAVELLEMTKRLGESRP